jgi:amino-acid N-acetyltransferase
MEEQRLLIEETLEKRIAEEKAKIDTVLAEAKAKEEARVANEQKRLMEAQLERRLAEEKSKLDAEIAATEEKIRRELELLESEKSALDEGAEEEEQVLDIPRPAADPPLEEEFALPDLASIKDLPSLSRTTTSDVLNTDVEALELVSMCQADYDSTYSTDSPSSTESCLLPSDYPFVSLLRDSSPYIVNHRHSTIVYHVPGDLISDVEKFSSVMDDIALTWLFGMKIVLCVGCRTQVSQRLDKLQGMRSKMKSGVRITTPEALRVLEEEAGFCRFEVERQLNRCLRNKGANCNVVSGCFITAKQYGVVDGVDYQHTGYPKTLQTDRIHRFLSRSDVVLLTPLGFTEDGQALNIKSEQLAGFTAGALQASKVVYFSTKPMVMRGSNIANQRIQMIQRSNALQILTHHGLTINSKTGFPHWRSASAAAKTPDVQSMLLKMGWATDAIDKGVERAHIIACDDGALLEELFTARRGYGTCISQDDYEAPHPEDQNDDLIAEEVGAGMIEW